METFMAQTKAAAFISLHIKWVKQLEFMWVAEFAISSSLLAIITSINWLLPIVPNVTLS